MQRALLLAAYLRPPEGVPDSEKQARVDSILGRLGITHLHSVCVGHGKKRGIGSGEMRRVSIGLDLVARPDAHLLDGPTLDSLSVAKVAKVLHVLARNWRTPLQSSRPSTS